MEYRGLYDLREKSNDKRYFEFGAHFRYSDLVRELKALQESQSLKKEKNSNINNCILNSNNTNYNELFNHINQQLCQKMTDIISPNKLIQSRNIKPLIQSLSQKLTDIVQSQNNKKSLKHNVTKNKCINSNCSTKQKIKNNIINISNNKNSGNKNINISNNIKIKNIMKGVEQDYLDICPPSSKQQDLAQLRNYIKNKNKKGLIKKNSKNTQKSLNKDNNNNIDSQEIKHYINIQNKNHNSRKNINNYNYSNNNEIIYGSIIDNNNINNSNNNQNAQTVQNIIVKPNINISFINNFNTTFLPKNKKHSPKKVRSRNNQENTKLNMIGNQIFNFNNNFNVPDGFGENINNRVYHHNNNESVIQKNKNKTNIIFLRKNNDKINLKQMHKKSPFISPKMRIKNINNDNTNKKNVASCNNRNIKINGNFNNNFIIKDQNQQNNIIQEKLTRNINKKMIKNLQGKSKICKIKNETNKINNLNSGNLVNNYIKNNCSQNKNVKLNSNIDNNSSPQNRLSFINAHNDSKKKNMVIRNNIVLSNNISEKKKIQNNYIDENNYIINF